MEPSDLTIIVRMGGVEKMVVIPKEELATASSFEEMFALMTRRFETLFTGDEAVTGANMPVVVETAVQLEAQPEPVVTLDEMLERMQRAGQPSLFKQRTGWLCSVDMAMARAGEQYTVRSDTGMPNARAAIVQCFERMKEVMR